MNPANFQNGHPMMGGPKPHGQMPVPGKNENTQVIINRIAQALQAQGPFTGWRAEVPIKERALKAWQMITSLQLIQPRIDIQSATQAALGFEQKAFKDANQKSDYDNDCTDKLIHIRDTRARQAAAIQNGMTPQAGLPAGMAGMGSNPAQGGFPQQMNRPMQNSAMGGQLQMPMGMDPSQQPELQQQRHPPQPPQSMMQQQRGQQRPGGAPSLTDELSTLSPHEYDQVCRLASQMLAKTSPEHMEKIKLNLQNMAPEQRQYLAKKNMDPITYFFRSQALSHVRRHRKNRMEMARAQNTGLDPNGAAMMGDPTMMTPQQRQADQNMVNLQRNSAFPMNGQSGFDPLFMGNVENIQGQQVDGLRSQEAGQLVVPASSSQMSHQAFTPQNMFPMGGQPGQEGQGNMAGAGLSPQFRSQNRQSQQSQAQAQAHSAQRKSQMGMPAGQANPQAQQLPQQAPSMPMLNRPMGPGQMSPAQAAAQVRPPSRAPGIGQHPGGSQPGMQQRPQIPPGLPPAAQEQLSQMTPEQLNSFLMNQQRRSMANNQNTARGNASMSMPQNMSQPGQGPQMGNAQLNANQNMRNSVSLQLGAQLQNQLAQNQQSSGQQRPDQQQQRQHDLYKQHLLRQQSSGMEMTPEQVNEMDRMNFPPSILSNHPNMSTPPPKNIKTWGQLKQFANSNPHALGGMDVPRLMTLQKLHLAQLLAQGKETGRNLDQAGQGHGMTMNSLQGSAQAFMNPQNLPPGQQSVPMNMPAMRPITNNEIQLARQRMGPPGQHATDEQIRDLIHRNRQRQFMQAAQNRAAHAFSAQGVNQNQQVPQPSQAPATAPQDTSPAKQQPPPSQPAAQPQQPAKPQPPAKGSKGAVKQTSKRKPNNDEAAEAQENAAKKATQAQPAQNVPVPAPPRPNMPFSREQLAAMTPQQRAVLEAHMRKQGGQPRVSISRASAEEAWNNLPEKIRQLYDDIAKNVPAGEPVALAPDQKTGMVQQLRECTDMLGRMDTLVQWFAKIPGQEKNVRSLLAMRIQLMRQFKPGQDWNINDQFTIAPEYLSGTINYIKKLFQAMITKVNQQQNQAPGQRPQGPPPANQNNMPALNASNLQQLQQQEEALQRARRASGPGAVGPNAMPQPPFGAPSPQGVPHAYGPGSIPPEKLKLPPPKRRKQSHGAVSPTQGQVTATPSSKAQAATQPAGSTGLFKCSVAECQHHYQGFNSQSDLDKHVEESHQAEEPIENPLEFAIESIRDSLVKKVEPGQDPKRALAATMEGPQAGTKPGAATSHSKLQAKPDGATPIRGATPMGRASSQLASKTTPPVSSQQATPRTGKAPTSTALKRVGSKDGRKDTSKAEQPQPSTEVAMKDPWADSVISLDTIHDTFMGFGDESPNGLGFDPLDEYLNSEAFTKIRSKDTPDSIETGVATQTSRDSETSRDEDLVKIGSVTDDNWVPVDWFSLPSQFEDGMLMNEPWEDMDWETIDRKEAELNADDGGMPRYAM